MRKRSVSFARWPWLGAFSILAAFSVGPSAPAAAVSLARGDVLVAEAIGKRVLRVRPSTGATEQLSPRDALPNLIEQPRDMAIGPDGTIYLADGALHRVIAIDPDTGAQRFLTNYDFGQMAQVPVTFGDLRAITTDGLGRVHVFDDATQTVRQLTGSQIGWGGPAVWNVADGDSITATRMVAALDAGGLPHGFFAVVLAGTRIAGLEYGGTDVRAQVFGAPAGAEAIIADISVEGPCIDVPCTIAWAENVAGQFFSCAESAVFAIVRVPPEPGAPIGDPTPPEPTLAFDDFSGGGACASAVAAAGAEDVFVAFSTATGQFPRLERVRVLGGETSAASVSNLSTGPIGQSGRPIALAVWTLPEVESAGLAAFAALVALARSRAS